MTTLLPRGYDVLVARLALGIEPIDAHRGTRIAGRLTVTFDECPRPLSLWRPFPPGVFLDDVLPRATRHASGRYARIYDDATRRRSTPARPLQVAVRIGDPSRRFVARRLRITIPKEDVVTAAEADDTIADIAITTRVLAVHLHPGANADLSSAATVIRGRIVEAGQPVPWCRVRADDTDTGVECGFAHGDDRGEFVLPLITPDGTVGMPGDQLSVRLTVGFQPPAAPPPDDPLVPTVDPLWQLVEEAVSLPVPAPAPPATGDIANGRTFPPSFAVTTFVTPFPVSAGRTRSVLLALS